jgi:hypothetical protein
MVVGGELGSGTRYLKENQSVVLFVVFECTDSKEVSCEHLGKVDCSRCI